MQTLISQTRSGFLRLQAEEDVNEPELADFVSPAFEMLCQEALPNLYPEKLFLDIGRWWYNEHEVDVVGFTNEGTMVVGECKFTNASLDYSALASLEDHAAEIRWTPPGGEDVDIEYALFARSGATQSVQEAVAERDELQLFDLEEITEKA